MSFPDAASASAKHINKKSSIWLKYGVVYVTGSDLSTVQFKAANPAGYDYGQDSSSNNDQNSSNNDQNSSNNDQNSSNNEHHRSHHPKKHYQNEEHRDREYGDRDEYKDREYGDRDEHRDREYRDRDENRDREYGDRDGNRDHENNYNNHSGGRSNRRGGSSSKKPHGSPHEQIHFTVNGGPYEADVNALSTDPNTSGDQQFVRIRVAAVPADCDLVARLDQCDTSIHIDYTDYDFIGYPQAFNAPDAIIPAEHKVENFIKGAKALAFFGQTYQDPGLNGIHDIHRNNDSGGHFTSSDGAEQDGAIFAKNADGQWSIFAVAFSSQIQHATASQ